MRPSLKNDGLQLTNPNFQQWVDRRIFYHHLLVLRMKSWMKEWKKIVCYITKTNLVLGIFLMSRSCTTNQQFLRMPSVASWLNPPYFSAILCVSHVTMSDEWSYVCCIEHIYSSLSYWHVWLIHHHCTHVSCCIIS